MNRTLLASSILCVLLVIGACAVGGVDLPSSSPADVGDASYEGGYTEGFTDPFAQLDAANAPDSPPRPCPRDAGARMRLAILPTPPRAVAPTDASLDALPPVAGACPTPPGPGDLVIEELMIASQAGRGDRGEWVEVRSTLDCAVDIIGLHAEVPHGTRVDTADVTADLWVPPGGFVLLADSTDPMENHDLPGTLVAWNGMPADVLRNTGDTVTLSLAGATIDSFTYGRRKLTDGVSYAFPPDCDPALRADFGNWKESAASWAPGLFGTPAAPNDDVHCDALPSPPMPPPCLPPAP